MRLVKLNRRHKAFKEMNHTWAFRFDSYDIKRCPKIESILFNMHGSQYQYHNHSQIIWSAKFGSAPRGQVYRPYWISFKNEADATAILLSLDS